MRYTFKNYRKFPDVSLEDQNAMRYYLRWASTNYSNINVLNDEVPQYQKNKDKKLLDKIVKEAQPIVMKCARNFATNSQFLDYVSEGNIGLLHAIDTYKKNFKGNSKTFVQYAIICIMRQFQIYVNHADTVNYKLLSSAIFYLKRQIRYYYNIANEYPSFDEIKKMAQDAPYQYSKEQLEYFFLQKENLEDNDTAVSVVDFEDNDYAHKIIDTLRKAFPSEADERAINMILDSLGFGEYEMNDVALGDKYGCSNVTAKRVIATKMPVYREFVLQNIDRI